MPAHDGDSRLAGDVRPAPQDLAEDRAAQLGERKAANILKTGAKLLVTANPGCLLQIRASLERMGESMPLAHPMEVVDASIQGKPLDSIL